MVAKQDSPAGSAEPIGRMDDPRNITEFIDFLASLTEPQWQTKVNADWTVKDVIAHLIGWAYEVAVALPTVWETGEEPWFCKTCDYDEFNDGNVRRYKGLSPGETLAEYIRSEKIVNAEIDRIGESRLRESGKYGWLFDEGPNSHWMNHFRQIKRVLV
jgi:hypothetical protein